MSKQSRLAHLFSTSKAPASRAADDNAEEEEDIKGADEDGEEETDEDTAPEAEGDGDGEGDDEDTGDDEAEDEAEGSSAAAVAAIELMSSTEAKGREKLAASLAKDVARGRMTSKRATALLKSAPRTGGLSKAMAGRDRNPGQDRAGGPASGPKLAAHDESLVAAAEQRAKKRKSRG